MLAALVALPATDDGWRHDCSDVAVPFTRCVAIDTITTVLPPESPSVSPLSVTPSLLLFCQHHPVRHRWHCVLLFFHQHHHVSSYVTADTITTVVPPASPSVSILPHSPSLLSFCHHHPLRHRWHRRYCSFASITFCVTADIIIAVLPPWSPFVSPLKPSLPYFHCHHCLCHRFHDHCRSSTVITLCVTADITILFCVIADTVTVALPPESPCMLPRFKGGSWLSLENQCIRGNNIGSTKCSIFKSLDRLPPNVRCLDKWRTSHLKWLSCAFRKQTFPDSVETIMLI